MNPTPYAVSALEAGTLILAIVILLVLFAMVRVMGSMESMLNSMLHREGKRKEDDD